MCKKSNIHWKGKWPELQEYHFGEYVYFLGDSGIIGEEDMWCITREPDRKCPHKKYKTYKDMFAFLRPDWADPEDTEETALEHILYVTDGYFGCSLRNYEADGHKYAVDLEKKEILEYFDRERISPLYSHKSEARDWAEENLPHVEQLSLLDVMA